MFRLGFVRCQTHHGRAAIVHRGGYLRCIRYKGSSLRLTGCTPLWGVALQWLLGPGWVMNGVDAHDSCGEAGYACCERRNA